MRPYTASRMNDSVTPVSTSRRRRARSDRRRQRVDSRRQRESESQLSDDNCPEEQPVRGDSDNERRGTGDEPRRNRGDDQSRRHPAVPPSPEEGRHLRVEVFCGKRNRESALWGRWKLCHTAIQPPLGESDKCKRVPYNPPMKIRGLILGIFAVPGGGFDGVRAPLRPLRRARPARSWSACTGR